MGGQGSAFRLRRFGLGWAPVGWRGWTSTLGLALGLGLVAAALRRRER